MSHLSVSAANEDVVSLLLTLRLHQYAHLEHIHIRTTHLHGKVHVIALVSREPDQSVGPSRPEDDLERLAEAALVVRRRQPIQVVHHPRVAVAVPVVAVRRQSWGRRPRV